MDKGFVKLFRKFTKWEWYSDINTKTLFLHLLLTANHEDKNWKGILIKRGQVITGRKKLSEETGLTEQNIKTSLKRLKSTNEITTKITNKYTIVTLVNWEKYQDYDTRVTNKIPNKVTNNQPTTNQQLTTNNNDNNIYVYNNAHAREENYCHLGSLFKNEICVHCQKKNNCPHPVSIDFKLLHPDETFEEYDKRRIETLDQFIDDVKSRGDPKAEEYIPLFNYDWLKHMNKNEE